MIYDDLAPELLVRRTRAAALTSAYNASYGRPSAERLEILRQLFARCGANAHFEPTLRCEFGDGITIGDNFVANYDCVLLDGGGITIGDSVLFGPRVAVYTSNHLLVAAERIVGGCEDLPVVIGDRVWIGGGVTVNPGVTIGAEAVIGAGSVVTRDIPPGVVAAGVPCRVLRAIGEADRTGFTPGGNRVFVN